LVVKFFEVKVETVLMVEICEMSEKVSTGADADIANSAHEGGLSVLVKVHLHGGSAADLGADGFGIVGPELLEPALEGVDVDCLEGEVEHVFDVSVVVQKVQKGQFGQKTLCIVGAVEAVDTVRSENALLLFPHRKLLFFSLAFNFEESKIGDVRPDAFDQSVEALLFVLPALGVVVES
jgi:hypothetical protein